MSSMKGAVLYGNRDLRVVDVPKPAAGKDGVLIKVKAVGVCGTDVHTYKTGIFKEMSIPAEGGALFGHEFSGDIVDIPDGLKLDGLAPGDRVAGFSLGAYAEYCKADGALFGEPAVFKLPDNISYEEAATIEPLTVSLTAVRRADPQAGEKILIVGAGMIGLGCVQVLKALYPECDIIISDISEKRLDMAKQFGAHRTINPMKEDVVAAMKSATGEDVVLYNQSTTANIDVVIECAGLELTTNQALQIVKPHTGRLVVVALYEDKIHLDLNQIVTKNIDLLGILAYTMDDIWEAIGLMASGKVDRRPLITHRFALGDAKQAFEAQVNTADTLKAVIIP
ncbi:zinc-dependent alcohol dehydrogenase [Pseudoteredinibacter isoporae]|uniref:Threonine dehydrogenase-like Zn-dependent dehydrogenase n=1 Tax=Pseudoteredinibacter isoporae TaxID=570281 RepID=A0A7X0JSH0_9GAMM|nr:zinc-binding dehydrogenase [Pseudoteredinibacter isoporae]MBB6521024.1 threonine dehydrogenase-like Zn-dependent dehydrogenase [Pseudoteredinibacter isoporae]NHO86588.1 zinc-binding dehydrogenase [Pseudoteredinibacter isoporae]NIB24960.1 zinc-binding dehydrogenase [Pseudoteredinibacter isoporae]